jgi:hypothetical protein
MSTFYLLPSRPLLQRCLGEYLEPLFPGLTWSDRSASELAEILEAVVKLRSDVFVVYREDLPEGESPTRALADGFGAEPGDDVIEVSAAKIAGQWTSRRWRLDKAARAG